MKSRTAAVLALTVVLLTTLGWTGESWAQTKLPRVGVFTFIARGDDTTIGEWFEPFRRRLATQGWVEGKNVVFEYRSALGDPSQLAVAAAELVRLKVDVIWAAGAPMVRAAYGQTRTIPIVATDLTSDPVAAGYVESYGRPGGNVTGVFLDAPEFAGKWFELLEGMIPGLSRVAVMWDPSPGTAHMQAVEMVARSLRVQLQVLEVRTPDDIDRAFSALAERSQALIILPSPMVYVQSERLAKLAVKYRLLATSMAHLFAEAGGAVAYGPELMSVNERAAVFVAKILSGAKPGDLPVERPTKVQLIVNLKSVSALGLKVPDRILYRADEVIR